MFSSEKSDTEKKYSCLITLIMVVISVLSLRDVHIRYAGLIIFIIGLFLSGPAQFALNS